MDGYSNLYPVYANVKMEYPDGTSRTRDCLNPMRRGLEGSMIHEDGLICETVDMSDVRLDELMREISDYFGVVPLDEVEGLFLEVEHVEHSLVECERVSVILDKGCLRVERSRREWDEVPPREIGISQWFASTREQDGPVAGNKVGH